MTPSPRDETEISRLEVETVFNEAGHHVEIASFPDDPEIAASRCSCGWSDEVKGFDAYALALVAIGDHRSEVVPDARP